MPTSAGIFSCIAGMMLAIATSPVAQADDAGVIRDAHAIGIANSDVNIISAGRSVCYVLRLGNRPPAEISAKIARNFVIDQDQARRFSLVSANEWCPQWSSLFAD
ncbi:DUF732 domain-containing protein [Mycolicibacterium septicum]|uniref:DUF732 domain-containing protein n=1 Tax=Mycolicibacterium septicum TaxID=98668 RepID=UPI0023E1CE9E|nr:DUF732 domain-containing protein [Mycolicibacterium septicum]MDF3339484.1 DUF732 domain-containing protein [Mycolicibacterium septicum]